MPLNLADEIRRFVYQHYVVAARNRGRSDVEVRAGDVHHDMQLVGRMPAVCSALGAKFEMEYGLKRKRSPAALLLLRGWMCSDCPGWRASSDRYGRNQRRREGRLSTDRGSDRSDTTAAMVS